MFAGLRARQPISKRSLTAAFWNHIDDCAGTQCCSALQAIERLSDEGSQDLPSTSERSGIFAASSTFRGKAEKPSAEGCGGAAVQQLRLHHCSAFHAVRSPPSNPPHKWRELIKQWRRSFAAGPVNSAPFHDNKGAERHSGREDVAEVDPLWNWPNAISMARLISGPAIAYLVLQSHWQAAFVSLAISGTSDWLDGFVARKFKQGSVIGSYLDPLADKVLICSLVGALAYEGHFYKPLAVLIIGRDILLVTGAFFLRFRDCKYHWPGWKEFFRTTNKPSFSYASSTKQGPALEDSAAPDATGMEGSGSKPAAYVQPLYISKVNTVAQIALIAGCITIEPLGWPSEEVILGLTGLTGALTFASALAYLQKHRK